MKGIVIAVLFAAAVFLILLDWNIAAAIMAFLCGAATVTWINDDAEEAPEMIG